MLDSISKAPEMKLLAFFRSLFHPHGEPEPNLPMTTSQRIYNHARRDLGLKETPGKGSAQRIRDSIKRAAEWLDGDDSATAWCGCIRGLWGIETATGAPKAHYRAASWLNWGEPAAINDPWAWRQGDTLVFKRDGGFHVGLLDSVIWPDVEKKIRPSKINVLGGNQGNACNISPFPVSSLVGVRR